MAHLLENFSEVLRVCEKEVLVLVAPQYLIRLKYVLYVSRCDACGLRNFLDADFFLLILKKQAQHFVGPITYVGLVAQI